MKRASTLTPAKTTPSIREGRALGASLADKAPHVLLMEFSNRKQDQESDGAIKVGKLFEDLRAALGVVSTDPVVATLLSELDAAIWDVAVEHEDRAWFAAWGAAMALKGGA